MRYICHDCGNEIPDDMDFCLSCGCLREKATLVDDRTGMPLGICLSCGADIVPGSAFCSTCGKELPGMTYLQLKLRKHGTLALILALLSGFFNIFGLGHLVLREWSKGISFLVISLVLFYVNGFSLYSSTFLMSMLCVAVYFFQVMDLFRVAYSLEAK